MAAQHGPGQLQALHHFQRLDAPRKRGLRDVAQLRRAAKAAGIRQTDEIFKPFGFHDEIIGVRAKWATRKTSRTSPSGG